MRETLITRNLGKVKYEDALDKMRSFTDDRNRNSSDELWLVEHPAVFTLGSASKKEHLLRSSRIPVVRSDRGGKITYHGPGQCVVYLLIDLRRINLGVRSLVDLIETSVIDLLREYDILANKKAQAPGVYVGAEKIASLGLRVRKGCSYHGVALNVDMDLSPFQDIDPCGYKDLRVTSMVFFNSVAKTEKIGLEMLNSLGESLNPYYKKLEDINTFKAAVVK